MEVKIVKKYSKVLLAVILVIFLIASYYFFIYDNSVAEDKIDYLKVEKNIDNTILRATGTVVPDKIIDVKSSISGKIVEVNFDEGEKVKAGEEILSYDNKLIANEIKNLKVQKDRAKLSVEQAKISMEEAKASLELAKTQLENSKNTSIESYKFEIEQAEINLEEGKNKLKKYNNLLEKEAIEESKIEDQEYQVKILKNKLNLAKQKIEDRKREIDNNIREREKNLILAEKKYLNAEKNYEITQKSLKETEVAHERALEKNEDYYIKSPIEGIIKEKFVEKGEYVQPAENLFEIASNTLLIKISPDEREIGLLKENKIAYVSPEAYPDKKIEAKLTKISPSVDSQKGTIDVYYKPIENVADLVYNMTVSVDILNDEIDANKIYIPEKYLVNENQVYFYNQDNKAELVEVETGEYNEGKIEIKSGLEKGDIIISPEDAEKSKKINIEG